MKGNILLQYFIILIMIYILLNRVLRLLNFSTKGNVEALKNWFAHFYL
jgi:hypothetical protein